MSVAEDCYYDTRELLCPVHRRVTVNGICRDCIEQAAQGVALIESGVAGARAWAHAQRELHPEWPRRRAAA